MNSKYALHDDYRKKPGFNFVFSRPLMACMNAALKLENFFRCRKPAPGLRRETQHLTTAGGNTLDIILMTPEALGTPSPALVFYHGGAFALGYASAHVRQCERYALEAGCRVVLVDYRLVPRHPFPAGFDDCYATLQWTLDNAARLGIDPARIAVMGDSAGAALAAGVAQKAFDNGVSLCAQLLVYPVLDSECKTRSATEFIDTPMWNAVSNRRMWAVYLKNSNGKAPPYAAPGLRTALAGLPRCYLETAEFDPLHDEGVAYAGALTAQGVPVALYQTRGTIHGYDLAAQNPETKASMPRRIAYLREVFAR